MIEDRVHSENGKKNEKGAAENSVTFIMCCFFYLKTCLHK